jgi:glycosyltransferase involved in cell wall biosynthesis
MKIVIPVISLHRGGGCRVVTQLANGLAHYGHEVEIVMLRREPVYWPTTASIKRVRAITPEVIPKADVIIPNFFVTVMPAYESKQGKILRLSNGYEPLWTKGMQKRLAEKTYRIPVPVLSITDSLRRFIRTRIGRDSMVARPGIDHSVFRPQPKAPSRKKRIFYIYRAESHGYQMKGGRDFLAAMKIVMRAMPHVELHMVSTEKTPIETDLPYILRRAKSDQKMAHLYASSDLFVVSSWYESMSLPVLEAMACGTPVVTTACGGIDDFAVNEKNCLITPTRNPQRLAGAIMRILQDDDLRRRLSEEGRKTAVEWTWERFYREANDAVYRCVKGDYPL